MINVKLDGISKSYTRGKTVLEPIDLEVKGGELFFLLGPSGCGKSTLLRIIAGFVKPDAGQIFFDGIDISNLTPEKRGAAMVFQSYALWPHMTVRENIAFGLEIQGIKDAEKERRITEALELVQLSDLTSRKPPSLSGGQQQRVALARAIVVSPKLLLLDEPLSNLDAKLRDSMRVEIRRICKEAQLTAIYVTHDRKEALSMADRIALLNCGNLQQVGTPREIYRHPTNVFSAGFIGDCNLLPGKVTKTSSRNCVIQTAAGLMVAENFSAGLRTGAEVTLMIRPEAISLGVGTINNFTACATDESFLGESGQWKLQGEGFQLNWLELNSRERSADKKVKFHIAAENIVVLDS
ncbi:MAG: ABC transporter ATP-binding protein [Victivallaceae bacterium]|nr:ABC transporter ATP-binding protein [Victivallaceae bacterium]MDD4181777.1 ABC transporter ATP-binding protein [Victivallaceae bacterium]